MARKTIKFVLIMSDETKINSLVELQSYVKNDDTLKELLEYFIDGRLEKWLLARYYDEEANAIKILDKNDPDFALKFCKAIGVNYAPLNLKYLNVNLIEHEKKMRKALEDITSDSNIIENASSTASNQSELDFLIKNEKKTIYLWGDSFKLPIVGNISYIGILGKPLVDISLSNLDIVDIYKIKLENVLLPERFNQNPFKFAKVDDCVKFGSYTQTSNGQLQPIEWLVLSREEDRILVVSKYALYANRFDRSSNNWEKSEVRKWLNGEFYNKAFSNREKEYIIFSNLSDVGTTDNVFLLSKEDAERYFANDSERQCKPTEYLVKKHNWNETNEGYVCWWLRSPGLDFSFNIYDVSNKGIIHTYSVNYDFNVVRPALYIKL